MRIPLSAILLLALAAPAFAATPINETRPLSPTGNLDISNVKGRIQVRAWQRDEVKIEGSLGKGVEKLEIEGDHNNLEIKVRYPNNSRGSEATELLLTVPMRANLDITSVAANVDVQGVAPASLEIDSVSGDVFVAAAPGEFEANTVSGNLDATVNSPDVSLDTVSGEITLRGRLNGEIAVETVSGNINIAVNGERVRKLSVSTVSGDAGIRTALAGNGRIELESVSGDLRLVLPRDLSARVSAETFSGDLSAPGAQVNRPKVGPGASLQTRYGNGNGNGEISIETFSGDAELKLE
ncbi:MAG: DUF4097 family beta strand repeat-containing protein [Pseudoxanthomonas sp.]